jgi:acetylxylan esterase
LRPRTLAFERPASMSRYRNQVVTLASISLGLLIAAPARAGTYQKLNQSDWWQSVTNLPSYVNMYTFLPTTIASKPPIVVYCHHCQGTASSSHSSMASLETIADKNGFVIIYPEATGENCWDAGSTRSLKHGGGGDTGAVVQMVKYVISKYNGDAGRVYVAGDSAGGIMTEALLGVYPDVFTAGVSVMGVPCGCWASSYNDVTGTGSSAQWSGPCAGGTVKHTGQEWGDLVRSYFPGYTGHRPRLQHWHGMTDTTLNYSNMAQDILEWTNLLGLSEAPTGTEQNTPKSGTTHQYWKNSCYTVYETFALSGVGHAVSVDGNTLAKYFGIDTAGGSDPETAACGAGGASGTGGTTSAGGAKGTGGASAAGTGGKSTGGTTGVSSTVKALGGTPATGGTQSTGTGNGGAQATGGRAVVGGYPSSGGQGSGGIYAASTGGSLSTGGAVATGGSSAKSGIGGSAQTGGAVATTGGAVAATGGNSAAIVGTGGMQGSTGTTTQGGDTSVAMTGPDGGNSTGSCSCVVAGRTRHSLPTVPVLLLAALATLRRKTRRS